MIPHCLPPVAQAAPLRFLPAVFCGHQPADTLDPITALGLSTLFAGYEVYGCASATAALALALQAAARVTARVREVEVPEVVLPAYACPDLLAATLFAGCRPVLADMRRGGIAVDPADAAAAATANTIAVIDVRLLGLPGAGPALGRALRDARGSVREGPAIIEDCAHVWPDEAAASTADAVALSFGRGKPISLRWGGALLVRRGGKLDGWVPAIGRAAPSLARRLGHWTECVAYDMALTPWVFGTLTQIAGRRVDTIRLVPLRAIEGFPAHLLGALPRARALAARNNRTQSAVAAMLRETPGPWRTLVPTSWPDAGARLLRYPLLVDDEARRDRLHDALWGAGLGSSRMYRAPLDQLPDTAGRVPARRCPEATELARRLLTLPVHGGVRPFHIEAMRSAMRHFAAGAHS